MATKAALQSKEKALQEEIEKFRSIQKEMQKCVSSRTQLDGQLIENKNVKEELDLLEDGATVYKLVGPVLVTQDLSEARQTVQKRLDYIGHEITRYEDKLKDLEKKQETQADKLAVLQRDYQMAMMKAGIVR